MKKQNKTLIALAAALAVLAAGYAVLKIASDKKQSELDAENAAATAITSISDVTSVWFSNGSLELSFVKRGDAWVCEQHEAYPIKSTTIEDIAYRAGSLSAVRILDDHGGLSEYGLDDPELSVRVGSDSQQATLYISSGADAHYLSKDGDERVFTISDELPTALETDLLELIDYEDIPTVYADQITGMTLTKDAVTYEYERYESGEDEDGEPVYSWSCKKNGAEAKTLDANVSTAAYDVENVRFLDCVAYMEDSAGLHAFGLEDVSLEVSYETDAGEKKSFTLYIGGETGEAGESRFMGINDSLAVTIASSETVNELTSLLSSV